MTVILLQALIALSAVIMVVVIGALVLIPIITVVWSELAIRKLKTYNQQVTRRQQVKVIGQKLLYTVGIVLLILGVLFLSLQFMDFSIT